jgi:DNA polymerase III epsilon subunit-like protein
MNPNDFTTTYAQLTAGLAQEESASPTNEVEGLHTRYRRRCMLDEQLSALESAIYGLRERVNHLPWLPDLEQVRWAQALLAFPNLAFLEVDTDGLYEDADILRLLLVDKSGSPFYDQTFRPRRLIDRRTTHLTMLTPETVEDAPLLVEEWERITNAFAGRYIISFNLEFDQTKLRENAERYHLTPLPLIGSCLMEASRMYFHVAYPKLATVCTQVGFPLPNHPHQDAFDRIRGQIHLLEAMAQGITDVPAPEEAVSQDDDQC